MYECETLCLSGADSADTEMEFGMLGTSQGEPLGITLGTKKKEAIVNKRRNRAVTYAQ